MGRASSSTPVPRTLSLTNGPLLRFPSVFFLEYRNAQISRIYRRGKTRGHKCWIRFYCGRCWRGARHKSSRLGKFGKCAGPLKRCFPVRKVRPSSVWSLPCEKSYGTFRWKRCRFNGRCTIPVHNNVTWKYVEWKYVGVLFFVGSRFKFCHIFSSLKWAFAAKELSFPTGYIYKIPLSTLNC